MVFDWVKDNSPDLSKYSYQEWDQDIYDYVNHVITSVTGQGNISQKYDSIVNREKPVSSAPAAGSKSSEISVENINLDDEDFNPGSSDVPELDLPDLPEVEGIGGDLDDIIGNT